jgi:glycosyltransferase involved in cell wall biosynthesis
MNILFLCNKSPFPQKEGGPMAMNMLIKGLLRAGHHVKVLAMNSYKYRVDPEEIPEEYRRATGIELVDVDLRVRLLPALLNLLKGRSYHVERFISEKFRKVLTRVLQEQAYDIVQLETLYMAPYIRLIRRYSKARIVLRAHNIEHLIWERAAGEEHRALRKWYLVQLARTLREYEHQVAWQVDGIAAITGTDADYFTDLLAPSTSPVPVTDIPFGIDPDAYPLSAGPDPPTLFTIGSMNWLPNEEGVRWFLREVWPAVHRQFPGLKYYLAGRSMPAWMFHLNVPNVVVAGEVEDARAFMAEHSVMIVPLFSGSGIRIKIIEGMATGKTVISTRLGAEGIHYSNGGNILIADAPCEFFDMITLCLEDPERRTRIGLGGRRLVESMYHQTAITAKLVSFYRDLLG